MSAAVVLESGWVIEYLPLWTAIAVFFIFVLFSILFRVTSGKTSSRALIKTHFMFFLVYVLAALFLGQKHSYSFFDWAIGAFVYLSLHYSFFMYVHAVPRKSVSVNMCVTIMQSNGPTLSDLEQGYGQGKGMQYVVQDRMQSMEHMKMVRREGDAYVLGPFGRSIAKVHKLVLKIWSMSSNSGAEHG